MAFPILQFQGNGFGRLALEMFYRILASRLLPSWFAVTTPVTFLLVPAIPEGDAAVRWEATLSPGEDPESDAFYDRVEGRLTAMYQHWGYTVYHRPEMRLQQGVRTVITIMGRDFTAPLPLYADDLMLPVPDFKAWPSPLGSSPASGSSARHRRIHSGGPRATSTAQADPQLAVVVASATATGEFIPFPP